MNVNTEIVLASASPRRTELMGFARIPHMVAAADIDETLKPDELPQDYVARLSLEKVKAVAKNVQGHFFIGADTVVVLDNQILGKPIDGLDAFRMLAELSGRNHQVVTGFSIFDLQCDKSVTKIVITDVQFKILDQEEIRDYVATGCPLDKAGGYAIQGGAAHFVRTINGSYSNVVGLPMAELYETLQEMGAI